MRRVVLRGVAWVGGTMFLVRVVRFAALLLLGGLLAPRAFGLFAALHVIVDGLVLLQGFGIGHAFLCRRERTDEAADTAFYLSAGIGVVTVAAAWWLAPTIAEFYGEPEMVSLFRAASIVLALQAFRLVPFRLVEKSLEFRKKLAPTLSGAVAYGATALYLAYQGAGAWALVGGEIASLLFETTGYWIATGWRPKLRFDRSIAIEDLRFGWVVLGGSALIFAFRNIDRVTLSRFLGTDALGFYAFAYSLANLPATFFVRTLNTVLFPSYTALADDPEKQRRLFLRATSYMAGVGALYALGLVAFGGRFLGAVYGTKWDAAIPALRILAFFALLRALQALVGDLLVAIGRPVVFRAMNALQLGAAAAVIVPAAHVAGVPGVALAMTLAHAVSLGFGWARLRSALEIDHRRIYAAVRGPLIAAAPAVVLAAALLLWLPTDSGAALVVAAGLFVAAVFAGIWYAVDANLRHDVLELRAGRRPPGEGSA
jgi:PST family polysaccharide transporter